MTSNFVMTVFHKFYWSVLECFVSFLEKKNSVSKYFGINVKYSSRTSGFKIFCM